MNLLPWTPAGARPRPLDRWLRRAVLARLRGLRHGTLTLVEDGARHVFGSSDPGGLAAVVHVRDPAFWGAVALGGSIGAGESFMDGHWTCDDLTVLVRIFTRNRAVLNGLEGGLARLTAPLLKALHARNRNTQAGSRRNIEAHYDLGNEFFELFLDETMTYSAGVFESAESTLAEASRAKIDRACRKLSLRPEHHLLEIGAGWGALAIHASKHYGCRVTTTTLSREQHAYAVRRVRAAGLEGRVDVRLEDYRALAGRFDRLVSIEMVEAVGASFLETFARCCAERLTPDGRMLLQAITIQDQEYERARRSVDFIQKHVFPGSFIPSVTALTRAFTHATDMRLVHLEDFGAHYARTLAAWARNLSAHASDARALGFDDRFLRKWEFYLRYCEGGFEERVLGVAQMLWQKPAARFEPLLAAIPATAGPGRVASPGHAEQVGSPS